MMWRKRTPTDEEPRTDKVDSRIRVGFGQAVSMIYLYARKKIAEQVKSVSFIVVYLFLLQVLILRQPILNAAAVAAGIACVVVGLAFFIEGLFLGVMPLGEFCGLNLPGKMPLLFILLFSFILGIVATYAEPSILALRGAAGYIKPWRAPLLFLLTNVRPQLLLLAIGAGVGLAVLLSTLRFLRGWSLKLLLIAIVPPILAATLYCYFDPNLRLITALAWDTGGVTTGPVTVPLIIALGLGVTRAVGSRQLDLSGLGTVTLASLLPVLSVLVLGMSLVSTVPRPMSMEEFFRPEMRERASAAFGGERYLRAYALRNLPLEDALYLFDGSRERLVEYLAEAGGDRVLLERHFGGQRAFEAFVEKYLSESERSTVLERASHPAAPVREASALGGLLARNGRLALQAILPLTLFLVFVILVVLRVWPGKLDEFLLGVLFSLIGLFVFSLGIESGLASLGRQTGRNLPMTFMEIILPEQTRVIRHFPAESVWKAVTLDGKQTLYFYLDRGGKPTAVTFHPEAYDPASGRYVYVPRLGPLFGPEQRVTGILLALFFAFIMGYGATLAEPALNTLGRTLEELSAGTFKRSFLVRTVAVGVGIGLACGFARIFWTIPLVWFLVPSYLGLILLSLPASEEYVNIAWDSAGVTTGPITVPLVIALGLGIGNQVDAAESFGICALASLFPILSVLVAGQYLEHRRRKRLKQG